MDLFISSLWPSANCDGCLCFFLLHMFALPLTRVFFRNRKRTSCGYQKYWFMICRCLQKFICRCVGSFFQKEHVVRFHVSFWVWKLAVIELQATSLSRASYCDHCLIIHVFLSKSHAHSYCLFAPFAEIPLVSSHIISIEFIFWGFDFHAMAGMNFILRAMLINRSLDLSWSFQWDILPFWCCNLLPVSFRMIFRWDRWVTIGELTDLVIFEDSELRTKKYMR